jgi:CspA family cold shock protein
VHTGKLKFWNEIRGYGFLINDMGGDDFLHTTALRLAGIDSMTLHEGSRFAYEVEPTPKGNKTHACNVRILD